MHNMDAANTMPGDGKVSMVNGTTTENDAVRATSPLDMQEK